LSTAERERERARATVRVRKAPRSARGADDDESPTGRETEHVLP
jgi:hypothetical protein